MKILSTVVLMSLMIMSNFNLAQAKGNQYIGTPGKDLPDIVARFYCERAGIGGYVCDVPGYGRYYCLGKGTNCEKARKITKKFSTKRLPVLNVGMK